MDIGQRQHGLTVPATGARSLRTRQVCTLVTLALTATGLDSTDVHGHEPSKQVPRRHLCGTGRRS